MTLFNITYSATFLIGILIPILAIMAWYVNSYGRKKKSHNDKLDPHYINSEKNESGPGPDGEYHNDFSKVPAGFPDEVPPPPRAIGYGYGVGAQTMYEDLERIGIVEENGKKDQDKE